MALVLAQTLTSGPVHIMVGDIEILVDIVNIRGHQVKVSYTAPDDAVILRDKVYREDQYNEAL